MASQTAIAGAALLVLAADPVCPHEPDSNVQAEATPKSPLARAEAEVTRTMVGHFQVAKELDRAVIAGRFDAARKAGAQLAGLSPSSYPADWMPWILEMRAAAHLASNAEDAGAATRALGEVVAACSACHVGLGKGPSFSEVAGPSADASPMVVHRWAAARMWEGIVAPSEAAWTAGTARFPTLPECAPDFGGEIVDRAEIETARERVSELTSVAAKTGAGRARAMLYGKYVGTCAACHSAGC